MARLTLDDFEQLPPAMQAQIRAKLGELDPEPAAKAGGRGPRLKPTVPCGIADAERRAMSETKWQARVVKKAQGETWQHLHVRKSVGFRRGQGQSHTTTTNVKGWPDLFLWTSRWPGRFVAMELKAERGEPLSPDQVACLTSLGAAGVEVYGPVKPRHDGEVALILSTHPDHWPEGWVPSCAFRLEGA